MFTSVIESIVSGSLLNPHFFLGVFLGAVFAPLWVKIWNYAASFIVKKDPNLTPVVAEVTTVATDVVNAVTPVANEVNAIVTPAVLPSGTSTTK